MDGAPVRYHFAQAFGERGADQNALIQDVDIISAVQFNETGDLVATGDRGGRVVILEKEEPEDVDDEQANIVSDFRFWTQFQSHEPEFDYLKSMEIEEKINQIKWCKRSGDLNRLISTNDKTVKLWRISERSVYQPLESVAENYVNASKDKRCIKMPGVDSVGRAVQTKPQQVYSGGHAYHINSISVCADHETFISADDLRVNLWHYDQSPIGFNILDLKPDNMEDLIEVITAAEYHPTHCNLFVNSSSRGSVNLCDTRISAICEGYARVFESYEAENSEQQSFFSEIVASVSDLKWSPCGRYILTRDYMMLRLWDMNMEAAPLREISINENLRPRLCELYENDCVFDKFQATFSSDGSSAVVGSYNGLLQSFNLRTGNSQAIETSVDYATGHSSRCAYSSEQLTHFLHTESTVEELIDPMQRVTQVHCAPKGNAVAAAVGPALYVYYS